MGISTEVFRDGAIANRDEWIGRGTSVINPTHQDHYHKVDLRDKVQTAGGQWQPQEKLWKLPCETVINPCLDNRIIRFVMSDQA